MTLKVKSPGKLNLFLHITGRRSDGYHNLQTLFQFVDFYDDLSFEILNTPEIILETQIRGIKSGDNLIEKAARRLQEATGSPKGARITLTKRLPMGGGMGGGSSNAASTLVALNHLWQTGCSKAQLAEMGLALGADVPIFIHGHSALARGVGEQFENVEIPEPWYLIAMPNCHADTTQLFQEKQLTRDTKEIRIRDFLEGGGRNDFEPVLRKRFPIIDRTMLLMATMGTAKVTGSGACIFMQFQSQQQALQAEQQLNQNMQEFQLTDQDASWKVAKGNNHSLLYSGDLANQG